MEQRPRNRVAGWTVRPSGPFWIEGRLSPSSRTPRGRYLYINPAMEGLFGVLAAEVQGRASNAWLPEHLAEIIREQDPLTLATGPARGRHRCTMPRSDGAIEHWKVTRFPFTGSDGTPLIGGVAMNVTDLQDAQAKLAESERRYRHLVETGQGLICTHDMEGRLLTREPGGPHPDRPHRGTGDRPQPPRPAEPSVPRCLLPLPRAHAPRRHRRRHDVPAGGSNGRELAWKYRNVRVDEPGPAVLRPGPRAGRDRAARCRAAVAAARDDRRPDRVAQSPRLPGERIARPARCRATRHVAPPCSTSTSTISRASTTSTATMPGPR